MATNVISKRGEGAPVNKLTKEAVLLRAQMTHLWCKERLNFIHLFALILLGIGVFLLDHWWFYIVPMAGVLAQIALAFIVVFVALYLLVWKR